MSISKNREKLINTSIREFEKIYGETLILKDFTDEFLKHKKSQLIIEAYNSIVHRIIPNFYSALELLRKMEHIDVNIYPSIGLLLRASLMDISMFYYLRTFQTDENTFKTEIEVSDLDFIKNIIKLEQTENKQKTENELRPLILKKYLHLVKSESDFELFNFKEYRKNKKVREELYFIELDKVTDDAKLSQIEKFGTDVEILKSRYKLFSQFQHYSLSGTLLFHSSNEGILEFVIESFILISETIANISQLYCKQPIHDNIRKSISIISRELASK